MKDIIWTIIIIWAVYKLIDVFRSFSGKSYRENTQTAYGSYTHKSEGSVTVEQLKQQPSDKKPRHNPNDGEYVDFEEVK